MAGMLPNKLKNLFNLDFQLNNCCIVMEAIYQNLKDPPLGERPGTMLILVKLWPDLQHFILGLADWAIELRNLHIRLLVWVRDLVIGEYEPFIAIIAQLTIATYKISRQASMQAGGGGGGGAGHFFLNVIIVIVESWGLRADLGEFYQETIQTNGFM